MNKDLALNDYHQVFDNLSLIESQEANEIRKKLDNFKRLGMDEAYEQQKKGAVAFVLNSNGMKLIHKDGGPDYSGDYLISNIDKNGMHERLHIDDNFYWKCVDLKHYPRGDVPLDLLEKLPDDAAKRTKVFYLKSNPDPILVYPLPDGSFKTKRIPIIEGFIGRALTVITGGELYQTVQTTISNSPYYVGLYEW